MEKNRDFHKKFDDKNKLVYFQTDTKKKTAVGKKSFDKKGSDALKTVQKKELLNDKFVRKSTAGVQKICPVAKKCGGCEYQGKSYVSQLKDKETQVRKLLKPYCEVKPIIGMKEPYYYRNKVHAVFDHDRKGNPISGVYQAGTHVVVPVDSCLIEDQQADAIIVTIRFLLKSFKIRTYDEDTGYGLLRHVLVRKGFSTGEIMVVLVTASPVFPSKNNFVKALLKVHPEITTIVQNVNHRGDSIDRKSVV